MRGRWPTGGGSAEARTAVRDSVTVAGWTLASRVTGLLRVVLAGAVLGPTYFGNLFQTAYVLPAVIYSTVAGPVLSMVLVPAVVAAAERNGLPAARSVCAGIGGWVLVASTGAAALLGASSTVVAWVLTLGVPAQADPARARELAVLMVLFVVPQVVLYTVASLGIAAQQARGRFGLASAAPAVENLGLMATVVSAGLIWGTGLEYGSVPVEMVVWLGVGATLSVGLHALLQLVGAARCGMLVRPSRESMRSAGSVHARRRLVRSVGVAAWPAASMLAILSAAGTVPGGVVVLQIGYAVYNAATYLTGRAVSTAVLPRLARAASSGDSGEFTRQWRQGLTSTLAASAPLLVLLAAMASPLAGLLVRGELSAPWVVAALTGVLVVVALAQVAGGLHDLGRQALFARQCDARPRRASELAVLVTLSVAAAAHLVPAGAQRLIVLAMALLGGELVGMVVVLRSIRPALAARGIADAAALTGTARAVAAMVPLVLMGAWWHATALPGPLATAALVAGTGLAAVAVYGVVLRSTLARRPTRPR